MFIPSIFSVILRKSEHPHTKNIRKSDPVARYQEFRKSWDQQRAPGEKNHKNLRWNVREQMLAQDIVYEKVGMRLITCLLYIYHIHQTLSLLLVLLPGSPKNQPRECHDVTLLGFGEASSYSFERAFISNEVKRS